MAPHAPIAAMQRAVDGGYRRTCSHCSAELFPRTGDLGRNDVAGAWRGMSRRPQQALSAAFVLRPLPDLLNQARLWKRQYRRELFEEVELKIGAVSYHATQPSPFIIVDVGLLCQCLRPRLPNRRP